MISIIAQNGYNLFGYDYKLNEFEITPIVNTEDLSSLVTIIDVIK